VFHGAILDQWVHWYYRISAFLLLAKNRGDRGGIFRDALKNLFMIFQLAIFPNRIWLKKFICTNKSTRSSTPAILFASFQLFRAHGSRPTFLRVSFFSNVKK